MMENIDSSVQLGFSSRYLSKMEVARLRFRNSSIFMFISRGVFVMKAKRFR
jgi:hypothetical protein